MSVPMFSLTELTGREASAQRTVVIGTVELNWRVWIVLVSAFPIAVIIAAVLYPFLSTGAILVIPMVEGGALYMIHRRTRSGLKLRTYQAIWDRRKTAVDTFFICGQPIDLSAGRFITLTASSVPNPYYKPGPLPEFNDAQRDQIMYAPEPPTFVRPSPSVGQPVDVDVLTPPETPVFNADALFGARR